jgi:hypothetical protein
VNTRAEPADRAARVLDGPLVSRGRVPTGRGTVWEETVRGDHTAYVPEEGLRSLERNLPGTLRCLVPSVPDPDEPERAVWPPVSTDEVLFDALTAPGGPRGDTADVLAALGGFLAALHTVPADEAWPGLGDRGRGAAWRDALPALAADVDRVRDALADRASPALSRALAAPPAGGATALVHGRFSTALVVPGAVPAVLGWREAGRGRPMTDLAFMAAELVELAGAAGGGGGRRFADLGLALFAGYERGAGRGLTAAEHTELRHATARRVTEHLALNTVATGSARGPLGLLARCEDPFAALFTAFHGGTR